MAKEASRGVYYLCTNTCIIPVVLVLILISPSCSCLLLVNCVLSFCVGFCGFLKELCRVVVLHLCALSEGLKLHVCGVQICTGFIKGWALDRLTSCEVDFACLVCPLWRKVFLQRSLQQKGLPACENQFPSC